MLTSMYAIILVATGLLILSALTSVIAFRVGAPLLLVFLTIGLLAGEDGPGGIQFDNAELVYFIGSIALAIILYDSGFNTRARTFRLAAGPAVLLATGGVLVTAAIVGLAAWLFFGFSYLEGLLLGSIIGSTDAAAVFFLLRVGGVTIRERVRSTLEVESSSNDPIAILMTVALVELLAGGEGATGLGGFVLLVMQQMALGAVLGFAGGLGIVQLINRLRLEPGLYPIMSVGAAMLCFAITGVAGGSGFLAVYVAGLVAGNSKLRAVALIRRFQDGMSWISQIGMFLLLGLLAVPSQFPAVALQGIVVAAVLILVARPVAVWLCLLPFRYRPQDTAFIAWVGLRGAVSVLLAVVPIVGGLANSQQLFNIAFIAVLSSLLLQGWTISPVARWLGQVVPSKEGPVEKIELELPGGSAHEVVSYLIVPDSPIARGQRLPRWARPSLVVRAGASLRPRDAGRLRPGDYVYIFSLPRFVPLLDRLFAVPTALGEDDPQLHGHFPLDPTQSVGLLAETYGLRRPSGPDMSLADYVARRLSGAPEVGDRTDFDTMDLIVNAVDDQGRIRSIGLYFGPDYEPTPYSALVRRLRAVGDWLRARLRRGDA